MIIPNCPCCRNFNVFGLDDVGCCYLYMDYCDKIQDCVIKRHLRNIYNFDSKLNLIRDFLGSDFVFTDENKEFFYEQ